MKDTSLVDAIDRRQVSILIRSYRDSGLRNRIKRHGNVVMNANVHTERNSRWPTAISQCGTAYQMSWQSKWAASVAGNARPEYYPYQRYGRRTTRLVSWSRDASSLRSACALRRQEFFPCIAQLASSHATISTFSPRADMSPRDETARFFPLSPIFARLIAASSATVQDPNLRLI